MRQGHYFCVTVKFCRTLKDASVLQLGQRIPAQVAVVGLALNSRFWVPGALISSDKGMPTLSSRYAHCSLQTLQLTLRTLLSLSLERGNGDTGGEERREVQFMPQYVWPKLSFLQVAWLRHGCSLVCASVLDSPPERSWAELFLSAVLRLWAQAAARLAARNVDRKQVSHRAGHTWTVLNPTHCTMM